jgi:hypothetical protein
LINHLEPGWVVTGKIFSIGFEMTKLLKLFTMADMGGPNAPGGTAADGADTPCWVAVDDIGEKSAPGEKSGADFRARAEIQWV